MMEMNTQYGKIKLNDENGIESDAQTLAQLQEQEDEALRELGKKIKIED